MNSEPLRGFARITKAGSGYRLTDDFPEPAAELEAAAMANPSDPIEAVYARHPGGAIWALYSIGATSGVWDGVELVWDHSDSERFRRRLSIFTALRSL
jgi:hypothetical protein